MIRTVIIEDELPAARRLGKMLVQVEPNVQIEAVLDSVEASVAWLKNNPQPDLLFLDIQLGDGLSFSIFDQVQVDSFLVFTTAYDEYAIRAFEHNSIDYLLKPIEREKLGHTMAKFQKINAKHTPTDMKAIMQLLTQGKESYKTHFWVHVASQIQKVEVNEIVCISSTEKSTFALTIQGRSRVIDYSLDQLEKILDPALFFRINRQTIVHFEAIKQIELLSKNRLLVQTNVPTDQELVVSTSKQTRFKEWLDR